LWLFHGPLIEYELAAYESSESLSVLEISATAVLRLILPSVSPQAFCLVRTFAFERRDKVAQCGEQTRYRMACRPKSDDRQVQGSAFAPAVATAWSFSTVPPLTPIAPMTSPVAFFNSTPPGKVISPPLEISMW
jgi:hypothetical protein